MSTVDVVSINLFENEMPKSNTFNAGSFQLPHPSKRHLRYADGTGGEDAVLVSDDQQVLVVADGVGGWIREGIDSGVYSRELCR